MVIKILQKMGGVFRDRIQDSKVKEILLRFITQNW